MSAPNCYPHFVADQVLKAEHLNGMFDYLDQQNRQTRRSLIGMGIVCGLDISFADDTLHITKGCGLSSEGYMISLEDSDFTCCRDYSLPSDFDPNDDTDHDYKPMYSGLKMMRLVSDKDKKTGDVKLADVKNKFKSVAVMLFIERLNTDLKNCTTNDCNDKGEKVSFSVIPMLVWIESLLKNFPFSSEFYTTSKLPDIRMRRVNVPAKKLKSPTQIVNEFLGVCDDDLIGSISEVYQKTCKIYAPLLQSQNPNQFDQLDKILTERREKVKSNAPVFAQYVHDHFEDLIHAYQEFKNKAAEVISVCCPSEDLFPLHLLLGEADKTSTDTIIPFRQYFMYSPLFNKAGNVNEEINMLFNRLKILVEDFSLPEIKEAKSQAIKITPSRLGKYPLSERAIPFYYNINPLYKFWNHERSRNQMADTNLGYYSNLYSSAEFVVHPLRYDIEEYNFFRIEGHIGKTYADALSGIVTQRQQNNLPFDVIALNVSPALSAKNAKNVHCYFSDLESMYNVILAEILCKFHEIICPLANTKMIMKQVAVNETPVADNTALNETALEMNLKIIEDKKLKAEAMNSRLTRFNLGNNYTLMVQFIEDMKHQKTYHKGTFIKTFCKPSSGTFGAYYLQTLKRNNTTDAMYSNMAENNRITAMQLYFSLFDAVEDLIGATVLYTLANLDITEFSDTYKKLMQIVKRLFGLSAVAIDDGSLNQADFLRLGMLSELQYLCADSRLRELWYEYLKRVKTISAEKIFAAYATMHPGMEHKAGVPKGGTFVLVYNDKSSAAEVEKLMANNIQFKETPAAMTEVQSASGMKMMQKKYNESETIDAVKMIIEQKKDLYTTEQLQTFHDILGVIGAAQPGSYDVIQIPNKMIFADFYLPYLCCSDCAPISYIIENNATPVDDPAPVITINKIAVCRNDESDINGSVSPVGGALTLNGKTGLIVAGDGTFTIKSSDLSDGINSIEYITTTGNKANVFIIVNPLPDAGFTTKSTASVPADITFVSNNADNTATHFWDFGDSATSTDANPVHTYTPDSDNLEFTVTHSVTSKEGCRNTEQGTVKLQIKLTKAEGKKVFCFNDDIIFEDAALSMVMLDDTQMKKVFDENGINGIDDNSKLQFKGDMPVNDINFIIAYRIFTSTEIITKKVNVTILFSNATFTVSFGSNLKQPGFDFTAVNLAQDETASWRLVPDGNVQNEVVGQGKVFSLKVRALIFKSLNITLQISEGANAKCVTQNEVTLAFADLLKIRENNIVAKFPMK